MARVCHTAHLGSYGLNAVSVRTSARYHGYGAYFTFLCHNAFNNVLPDPSLGLGLACETKEASSYMFMASYSLSHAVDTPSINSHTMWSALFGFDCIVAIYCKQVLYCSFSQQ